MKRIFYNGKIRAERDRWVSALYIEDGQIIAVGSDEEILNMAESEEGVESENLEGRLTLPGFNDSHLHFLYTGRFLTQADLGGTKSIGEVKEVLQRFLREHDFEGGKWLQSYGWNEENWEEGRLLTRADLDQVTAEVPVLAARVCTHICTVNSPLLRLLGVDPDLPWKGESWIGVDENGIPNGIIYERVSETYNAMPRPGAEEIEEVLIQMGKKAAEVGLTSIQSDDLQSMPGYSGKDVIEAYRRLEGEGRLPVRVSEQCRITSLEEYEEFQANGYRTGQGNSLFRLGALKTFCDGSLGARTAWLKEDYSDDPGNRGIRIYEDREELWRLLERAHRDGMSAAIHCIGDGACEQAVSVIEEVQKKYPEQKNRHGIVHAQILSKDLIERMAKAGILGYIQPVFLECDLHMAESRVGRDRLEYSYDFRRMYDAGIKIPFGTDAPVEPFAPMDNIYCAVTGMDFDGKPEGGWHTEKLLTLDEAVDCYTAHSAYASFEENYKGRLLPGFVADFTVLDRDIFSIPPEDIKDVRPVLTVMGGSVTYRRK